MEERRLHSLIVLLYETKNRELIKLAEQIDNPKYQDGIRKLYLDQKLEKVLETLIDPQSMYMIRKANKNIKKISNKLLFNGGWYSSKNSISCLDREDEVIKTHLDGKIPDFRLFYLYRDNTGYHVQNNVVENDSIFHFIRKIELEFFNKYQKELNILHQSYTLKETVMSGEYLVDKSNSDLAELICEYFGYPKNKTIEEGKTCKL